MRRRRRHRRHNPIKKSTLYWILGGVGALGAGGLIYWLATRNATKALTTSGNSGPPLSNTPQGASSSLPPPTSNQQHTQPQPTQAVQTPQGYNQFLQDASNFVNTLKGVGVAVSTIINLYNNLVNVVAQQFQVSLPSLVPANLGLSSWPPGISSVF